MSGGIEVHGLPLEIAYGVIGVVFAASALVAVYKIVRGPTILDRMIASDVLLTTLILVVGAEMVYSGHTRNISMMTVLAGTAVFATIAVARYVSVQDRPGTAAVPDSVVANHPDADASVVDRGSSDVGAVTAAADAPPEGGELR